MLHMVTETSRNEHSSSQHFLLVLRLEMQLLCKQNMPYEPAGCGPAGIPGGRLREGAWGRTM